MLPSNRQVRLFAAGWTVVVFAYGAIYAVTAPEPPPKVRPTNGEWPRLERDVLDFLATYA